MAVHFVTGKLGGGKSLVSVGRIRDYLLAGKKVATNLDINLEHLLPNGYQGKCEVYRVPDKPNSDDLHSIGYGTKSKRDEDFGLLVLDELGTWLNSRNYQKDSDRQGVIDWFLHARKYGWDVILIVQDIDLIDKQVRISLCEHLCICRRTDRIPIPFLSFLLKTLTGWQPKFPRIHVGSVFYGTGAGAIKVDTWVFRGNSLFRCYDTSQVFLNNPNRLAQYLPPSQLKPLNLAIKNARFYMRLTKIYYKRFRVPLVFFAGLTCNFILLFLFSIYTNASVPAQEEKKLINQESRFIEKESAEKRAGDPEEVERKIRYKLSAIVEYVKKRQRVSLIFDNQIFPLKTFPFPVEMVRGEYYAIMLPSDVPTLQMEETN